MKKLFIIVISCIALLNLYCQEPLTTKSARAAKFYEEGKEYYRLFYYKEAEETLLRAIDADEKFIEPYMVLAKLYWDRNRLEEAIETYKKGLAIDPPFYVHGFLYEASLETKLGRYSDALSNYSKVLELEQKDQKLIALAKKGIEQSNFAINAVKNPVEFKPVRLSANINSEDDEYWPSLSADESTLVYTRLLGSADKSPNMHEDFYESVLKDSIWVLARNVGAPLNTYDNEGAQSLSANGMVMIYTVCNRRGVLGRCDLYISEKTGKNWSVPQNIGAPVNSGAKETQPGITADGRTIYFASDRGGGKGGLDIWVTHQNENGIWSIPENLGDSVNTPGNESSPFIHPDNNTLYFSSDYLLGMGGFDIFYSRRNQSGKWNKAINLGYPINTSNDEIGLIINSKGNKAYFSSDVNSETGKDIYQFELYPEARPQEVSYLKGKVFDATNKKPLRAAFELISLENEQLLYKSFSDGSTGEFLVTIPTNHKYMLNVSKEAYLFFSENFSLEGVNHIEKPFLKDVPLQPILAGQTIILKNIFFETDSYELKPESKSELNKLLSFLNKNPAIRVEISGHTDNVGSEQYNQTLSEKRAKSVVDYLINAGIASNRLIAKGYAFSKPIDTNNTELGRANNRRTELTVIN